MLVLMSVHRTAKDFASASNTIWPLLTTMLVLMSVHRTAKDFASASDKIWPLFAAMQLDRTPRTELIEKHIIRRVSTNHISHPTLLLW